MKTMRFGNNTMPRVSFELPYILSQKIRAKTRMEKTTIKEVGIRLFDKYVSGEIKLPVKSPTTNKKA